MPGGRCARAACRAGPNSRSATALAVAAASLHADGVVVDKIYHPYVQPLERELEWRATWQDEQPGRPDDLQVCRLAYGQAFGDRWFGELYLLGSNSSEDSFDIDAWELELQRQLTEQGEDVEEESETRLGLQARYRYSPAFEPAVEIYSGEDTRGIGPAVMGQIRLGGRRQMRWEAGAIFGLDSQSPDTTLRFLLEFEF